MILLAKTMQRANSYVSTAGLGPAMNSGSNRIVTEIQPDRLRGIGRGEVVVVLDRASLNFDVQNDLSHLAQIGVAIINVDPEVRADLENSSTPELYAELERRGQLNGEFGNVRLSRTYYASTRVREWGPVPEFANAEDAQAWLDKQTEALEAGRG